MNSISKNADRPDAFENNKANAQAKSNIKSTSREFKIMSLNIFTLIKHSDDLRVPVIAKSQKY